jgi:anti-anti-sigma factor
MIKTLSLERLCPGDHVCLIVDDDGARLRGLITYIRAGLRQNHQISYFTDGSARIAAELTAQCTDTADALATGQLRISSPEQAYRSGAEFDPEAAIAGWRRESAEARAAGYGGLRAIGDMSWAGRADPGIDRLSWHEAQANRVFADGFAMAVCLYDARRFSPTALQKISWSHPATAGPGTDPALVPQLRAVRTTDPPGIRLSGEADMSNRHAFRVVMDHLVDDTPPTDGPLTVDISGLRFADSAAIRILIRTTATKAGRLRVAGCSPAMLRLLRFNGADAVAGLGVDGLR